jgi:hypothetical protein
MLNFTIKSQKFIYTIPCILILICCKKEEKITPVIKTPPTYSQYADSVISFSSKYTAQFWGVNQIIGSPNTYPSYGYLSTAWAFAKPDSLR